MLVGRGCTVCSSTPYITRVHTKVATQSPTGLWPPSIALGTGSSVPGGVSLTFVIWWCDSTLCICTLSTEGYRLRFTNPTTHHYHLFKLSLPGPPHPQLGMERLLRSQHELRVRRLRSRREEATSEWKKPQRHAASP